MLHWSLTIILQIGHLNRCLSLCAAAISAGDNGFNVALHFLHLLHASLLIYCSDSASDWVDGGAWRNLCIKRKFCIMSSAYSEDMHHGLSSVPSVAHSVDNVVDMGMCTWSWWSKGPGWSKLAKSGWRHTVITCGGSAVGPGTFNVHYSLSSDKTNLIHGFIVK